MATRQEWLDGLAQYCEVAVDYRTQGKGSKVYKIQAIVATAKYPRAFLVNGMRFSPSGEFIGEDDREMWPGPCCLEDPDSKRFASELSTPRQVSERWHASQTLQRLTVCLDNIPTEKLLAMVRAFNPDYRPEW